MGTETLITVVGIAATVVLAMMGLVAAVYLRLGKLESRIDGLESGMSKLDARLDDDVKELRVGLTEVITLMREHMGYHEGIAAARSASGDDN